MNGKTCRGRDRDALRATACATTARSATTSPKYLIRNDLSCHRNFAECSAQVRRSPPETRRQNALLSAQAAPINDAGNDSREATHGSRPQNVSQDHQPRRRGRDDGERACRPRRTPSRRAARRTGEPKELPKGMTFATLRRPDGYGFGLGLRTDRGILDVAAAEQDFREGAPTTIDAVFKGQGDINGLKRLVDKARASASADRYFVAPDKAAFGPVRHQPGKDHLHRAQLPQARRRDRQPGAEAADPVQQIQHRAELPRRHHRRVGGGRPEVRLRGRAGDRDRARAPATSARRTRPTTSSAMPPATTSPRATCSRARPSGCSARAWTARRRSGRGSSPPIRSTATTSRSNAGSTARCASPRTPPTWCSTASSS